ncbi:MAG TPA: chemotaxis protein CheB [Methylomirabilota bacterium]|jgi:two-component system chemotaxis response regulator CheB
MMSLPRGAPRTAAHFEVVAIGASAAGVGALTQLPAALPRSFSAVVLIAQHLDPSRKSVLASLLDRRCLLPVGEARDGESLVSGRVYVSPPDHHLTVDHGRVALTQTVPVYFARPSVDVLFTWIAEEYGQSAIGVILSGSGRDGARAAIKHRGGVTIVQDPREAEHSRMPESALLTGCVDVVLPLPSIGSALARLVLEGQRTAS